MLEQTVAVSFTGKDQLIQSIKAHFEIIKDEAIPSDVDLMVIDKYRQLQQILLKIGLDTDISKREIDELPQDQIDILIQLINDKFIICHNYLKVLKIERNLRVLVL